LRQKHGKIIDVTSREGLEAHAGFAAYSASKSAVYVTQEGEWRLVTAQGTQISPAPQQSAAWPGTQAASCKFGPESGDTKNAIPL